MQSRTVLILIQGGGRFRSSTKQATQGLDKWLALVYARVAKSNRGDVQVSADLLISNHPWGPHYLSKSVTLEDLQGVKVRRGRSGECERPRMSTPLSGLSCIGGA